MDASPRAAAATDDGVVRRVQAFLAEEPLGRGRGGFVVAVSGGADSLCLLDVLGRLRPGRRGGLRVVHVDHGFRPESALDAEFVQGVARRLDVPSEVVRVDGPGYARAHRLGLEHAARALRYRALATAAARHGCGAILTGHTADDSVESFVMHLLRGAGTDGLRGLAPIETLDVRRLGPGLHDAAAPAATVARPLLNVRRAETAAYCRERGLAWRVDPTNDDTAFLRNRVRHHLLPVLRTYNPAIDAALARTAAVLRDDGAWLDSLTARRWRSFELGPAAAEVPLATWRRQPRAARRRLLRRAAAWLTDDGELPGFDATERALTQVATGRPGVVRLTRRVTLDRIGDRLRVRREGGA